ncbi:hypothetical protein K491DRAFT_775373 [Lophiostoma macrostomum CBS 122681]|uniref:WD-like domain-containing protein n=1 Tax=Lophiostoma macrostomum CBS 122681 TaxID=1314788 RepID=A0A6A6TIV7_9PLEO|nr:hypothetical protein K491DRAFT_775373 [Lophiostoma macrostomum CBS 122681]
MHYKSSILFLGSFLSESLMAAPLNSTDMHPLGRPELYRENSTHAGYELIFYGAIPDENTRRQAQGPGGLQPRSTGCYSTADPICDSGNGATNDLCQQLVLDLYDNPNVEVGKSPRQMCLSGGTDGYCCISWGTEIDGLFKYDFADNSEKILGKCTTNGVSGRMENVAIGPGCSALCMSKRGTHCK